MPLVQNTLEQPGGLPHRIPLDFWVCMSGQPALNQSAGKKSSYLTA